MRWSAFLICASLALTACAQQPGSLSRTLHIPTDRYTALLAASQDRGPVQADQQVSFLLTLRQPAAAQVQRGLAAIYDPHSPRFGHFLTSAAWDRTYGPAAAEVASARTYLRRSGIETVWNQGDAWMIASAPARRVEALFHVPIHRYVSAAGTPFYAASRDPQIPAALRPIVTGSGHISSYLRRVRLASAEPGLTPANLLTVYDLNPLRSRKLDGSGVTVAFIETDGFRQKDLDAFTSHFKLPAMHPRVMFGPTLKDVAGETEMDLEVVHEIAPGAKLAIYNCTADCGATDMLKVEARAVRDNPGQIISISLGGCEADEGRTLVTAESQSFIRADALGESVFVASGDSGAFTCLTRDWGAPPASKYVGTSSPATSPGVTAVGGTRLTLNADGSRHSEEVWEVPPQTSGSGGGVSAFFTRPSWQRGPGVANSYDSAGRREVPDVSAVADPDTSPTIEVQGDLASGGGTSESAPIWAGMTALVDQYLHQNKMHPAGFLNPALYALAASPPASAPFHDVTVGTNLKYPAGPGYDLASGLGTPDGWNLTEDLVAYWRGAKR